MKAISRIRTDSEGKDFFRMKGSGESAKKEYDALQKTYHQGTFIFTTGKFETEQDSNEFKAMVCAETKGPNADLEKVHLDLRAKGWWVDPEMA